METQELEEMTQTLKALSDKMRLQICTREQPIDRRLHRQPRLQRRRLPIVNQLRRHHHIGIRLSRNSL